MNITCPCENLYVPFKPQDPIRTFGINKIIPQIIVIPNTPAEVCPCDSVPVSYYDKILSFF